MSDGMGVSKKPKPRAYLQADRVEVYSPPPPENLEGGAKTRSGVGTQ